MNTFKKYVLAVVIALNAAIACYADVPTFDQHDVNQFDAGFYSKLQEHKNWSTLKSVQSLGLTSKTVNLLDKQKRNVLHIACEHNAPIEVISYLVALGAEKNLRDQNGITPINIVCGKGNVEVAQLLIHAGAEVHENSIHEASYAGNLVLVKMLHEEKDIRLNYFAKESMPTSLHRACAGGNLDLVKYLVKQGVMAVVSQYAKVGEDTLLHAASYHGHINIAEYLIDELKLDVNAKGKDNRTPLMAATSGMFLHTDKARQDQMVAFLISKGAA
ncbi:MAG: ankyrin repeat domain-containing protein [Pseudomonadota bacterium]